MYTQLELWPTSQNPSLSPKIWKTLTKEQKQEVITALAKLIRKTVLQECISKEDSHER